MQANYDIRKIDYLKVHNVVYTGWRKKTCPSNADIVLSGKVVMNFKNMF